MKRISIKLKYTAVFALVLSAAIALSVFLNNMLLERYYISEKTDTMLDAYVMLEQMMIMIDSGEYDTTEGESDASSVSDETSDLPQIGPLPGSSPITNETDFFTSESTEDESSSELVDLLNRIQEESAIVTLVIMDGDAVTADGVDVTWILHILNEKQMTFNKDTDDKNMDQLLEKSDNYQIVKTYDSSANTYYLEGWGYFDDGSMFLMRTPLSSIKESVSISNRLYIYVGIGALIAGIVVMYFIMGFMTKPIIRLTHISKKMSDLDFDAKYEGNSNDEIGELGMHMNDLSNTLEKTIAQLKEANLELQNDLEQRNETERMRTEFLGNVSHELKTPLAVIQGYAEGLLDGVADDPESTKFYCEVIIDEADKMNRMVKKLLSLNQLEFGQDQLDISRFDITALVKGVANAAHILAEQKEATIIFNQRDSVYVWGDEYKLEEVITNYVSNAINHVDGKKIIEIEVIKTEDGCRVTVYNTGHQIPEEDLNKVWDKFYKVDKAHTREYGGNGIGLSIVKAVIDLHHGKCGVENREDGVMFWFELFETSGMNTEKLNIK